MMKINAPITYYQTTSNHLKRISLFDLTHMIIMADLICMILIDSVCSLEKEFIKLIHMNPLMILYLTVNQVDSYHSCIYGPLA